MVLMIYDSAMPGFDVQWISTYPEESEVILFGGRSAVQIVRIHKLENRKPRTFQDELSAIQTIRAFAKGASSDDRITENAKSLTFSMIHSVLHDALNDNIPSPYIQNLLMYQIKNASRYIYFDYDILLEDYKFLHQIIKKDESESAEDLFHIDRLCKIFPNCRQMMFTMSEACEQREAFWISVCSDVLRVEREVVVSFEWIDGRNSSGTGMALLSWESKAVRYCQSEYNGLQIKYIDKTGIITISRSRTQMIVPETTVDLESSAIYDKEILNRNLTRMKLEVTQNAKERQHQSGDKVIASGTDYAERKIKKSSSLRDNSLNALDAEGPMSMC